MTDSDDLKVAELKKLLTVLLVVISISEMGFCAVAVVALVNEWPYAIAFLIAVAAVHGILFLTAVLFVNGKVRAVRETDGFDD